MPACPRPPTTPPHRSAPCPASTACSPSRRWPPRSSATGATSSSMRSATTSQAPARPPPVVGACRPPTASRAPSPRGWRRGRGRGRRPSSTPRVSSCTPTLGVRRSPQRPPARSRPAPRAMPTWRWPSRAAGAGRAMRPSPTCCVSSSEPRPGSRSTTTPAPCCSGSRPWHRAGRSSSRGARPARSAAASASPTCWRRVARGSWRWAPSTGRTPTTTSARSPRRPARCWSCTAAISKWSGSRTRLGSARSRRSAGRTACRCCTTSAAVRCSIPPRMA